jgi:hypothetical protein
MKDGHGTMVIFQIINGENTKHGNIIEKQNIKPVKMKNTKL